MQLIECPWCGPREEVEFTYGGQAHVPYPESPAELDDEQWAHYVFFRDNTRGTLAERWNHGAGCRRWFNAVRDTVTYRFSAVYRTAEPMPASVPLPSASPEQTSPEQTSPEHTSPEQTTSPVSTTSAAVTA